MLSVDALVDWGVAELEVSLLAPEVGTGGGESVPSVCRYEVAAFVSHIAQSGAIALARMRSGHYVACIKKRGQWFEVSDNDVVALESSPTRFPYLVFLRCMDRKRLRGKCRDVCAPDASLLMASQKRPRGQHAVGKGVPMSVHSFMGVHGSSACEHTASLPQAPLNSP